MYYHAWFRVEGGSQAIPNLTRAKLLSDVVVPFINKHVRVVDYHATDDAILNFSGVAYLVVMETDERLVGTQASAAELYVASANRLYKNCTREILEEAWTSRAEEGLKSLIQRALAPPKHQVFVVMKFGDSELDSAYEGVMKPLIKKFGLGCLRIDEVGSAGLITEEIQEAIAASEVILCDLSGNRPNCHFETGFAHALGRRMILTIRRGEEPHFDLAGHRFILWATENELRTALRKRLEDMIGKPGPGTDSETGSQNGAPTSRPRT